VGGSGSAAGRLGLVERVDGDPAPADGAGQRAAQAEVNLADGGARERLADVASALRVAVVRPVGRVVDLDPAVAVLPAAPQDRVVRVQELAVEPRDLERAEARADVDADDLLVAVPRGVFDFEELEIAVQELVDRGLGPRVALLVDLRGEPALHLRGLLASVLARGDGLDEVVPLAAEWVDARVHADAEGAVGADLDLAALSSGHGPEASRFAPTMAPTPVDNSRPRPADLCAPGRIRTCDTRFRRAVLYPLSYEGLG
jgi:hypothetical protein